MSTASKCLVYEGSLARPAAKLVVYSHHIFGPPSPLVFHPRRLADGWAGDIRIYSAEGLKLEVCVRVHVRFRPRFLRADLLRLPSQNI
jgi:hypothetical protein